MVLLNGHLDVGVEELTNKGLLLCINDKNGIGSTFRYKDGGGLWDKEGIG